MIVQKQRNIFLFITTGLAFRLSRYYLVVALKATRFSNIGCCFLYDCSCCLGGKGNLY